MRSKAKTAASHFGSVSVGKGYKSDVLVRVCLWQQSDPSSENEGSNPSASISERGLMVKRAGMVS